MVKIRKDPFGITRDGSPVTCFIMENESGMCVRALEYGCVIQSILVPDRNGKQVDVALGYDDIRGYEDGNCSFGAFVGRYANRIKGACFTLNGKEYRLEKNSGENHLHGVLSRKVFLGSIQDNTVVFRYISPDGEEGFPGTLTVEVRYTLRDDNAIELEYLASTDKDTVINFTNHTYFNLNGDGKDILGHHLHLLSDRFSEINEETIPTGRILPAEGPMDFREGKQIGQDIFSDSNQLPTCRGYDHNYVLDSGASGSTLKLFAEAESDQSGIRLEALTTEPAFQLYTGNFVDTDSAPFGKGGIRYPRHGGFCLEAQHYPCSPNFPSFPTTVLHPGEVYRQQTVYRFHSRD